MPRKNSFQWRQEDGLGDDFERKSRSQKKRESSAKQTLGEDLAKLPLRSLEQLAMPPKLIEAYRELPRIKSREARRRHFQYIGRLIRETEDTSRFEYALALFEDGQPITAAIAMNPAQDEDEQ